MYDDVLKTYVYVLKTYDNVKTYHAGLHQLMYDNVPQNLKRISKSTCSKKWRINIHFCRKSVGYVYE